MKDLELVKAGALMPLSTAARICYAAVYSHRVQDVPLFDERLTDLAGTIMSLAPVYRRKPEEPLGRRLAEEEFAGGKVQHGGRELHFADGRSPLADLHIPREAVDAVIERLTAPHPAP